ncbi:DUF742 domain-containing protein [Saccharomonospora azurea]|jgi:hypothetical protein|uniref:DUF742 domain-containing protein n=1 Tax=Saccharomonospora azurea NA-128 TaxID=882081 RepID=H8GDB7_9PSEU|nr:DUF742 domain-containing protein [Saccharomonospora azurea]EHK85646.1 hypothetical protein SZMC14600_16126 [Saccharomonospora azurea SZMC 14600]EHY89881.1 Protein of unknown function (DUF742) [Saccharomonospora azurea NA-128]
MSDQDEEMWDDGGAGLVRSYVVTGGRTRSDNYGLDMMTLVVALCTPAEATHLPEEYERIVRLCQQPMSVAEVGGHIDLPLPVVKVLLSDLIEQNYVIFRKAAPPSEAPNKHVLQAVLDGIRKL